MLGRGLWLKTTTFLVFFLLLEKSLKNLLIIGLLILLITSMVLGLLFPLQIFLHLCERIAGDFNKTDTTEAVALDIIPNTFNRIWHISLLHKLKSMEFQVGCLA